jgi:membrane associated rhomboid family serine protease
MIPIRTDSPLRHTPWMNWGIIAVNVALFLLQHRMPSLQHKLALNPRMPTVLEFLTYSLVHANGAHLVGNMLFLYIFGNNVNDKMGHIGYLGFYLAAGVFSGIVYTTGGDTKMVIGASGAVSAITGAYIVLFPRAHVTVLFFFFYVAVFEWPSIWFIAFFFLKDLVMNFSGAPTGVAHAAHLGGTIFGFLICFVLLYLQLLPRDHFDVVALAKQWNRRRQFRDLTASGYDPFGYSERVRVENRLPAPVTEQQTRAQELKAQIAQAHADHDHARAADLYLELKTVDREQVLSRQAQLEIANQLASQQKYPEAAEAYESFLRHYKNFEQVEQVELMLGLIYARYLQRYTHAREILLRAMARLHGDRELGLAREELKRIEPLIAPP